MSWVIYDFSHMLICLLWFCHGLPKGEIVRTYVFHMLGAYVTILCNWLILWQTTLYLYLGRSKMCLIPQETLFQVQNHASLSKIQVWKVLFFKARQLASIEPWRAVEAHGLIVARPIGIYRGLWSSVFKDCFSSNP